MTMPMSCSISRTVVFQLVADSCHEPAHFPLFLAIHSGDRFVQQENFRPHDERAGELDTLLQAVGKILDVLVLHVIEFQEADDFAVHLGVE